MQTEVAAAWPAPPRYYLEPLRRPPPPPPNGSYGMYGLTRPDLGETPPAAPLEQQLYEDGKDPCGELHKLNHKLLHAFLALLQTVQEAPTRCNERVDEMRHLLLNMQHLINTFRPFQAREELIAIMQSQVDAKRALLDECRGAAATCAALTRRESVHAASAAAGGASIPFEEEMDIDAEADKVAAEVLEQDASGSLSAAMDACLQPPR